MDGSQVRNWWLSSEIIFMVPLAAQLTSTDKLICIRANSDDSWLDITHLVETFAVGDGDLTTEDSGRSLDGTMHNKVVIDKEYYDITLKTLTWTQMANVMSVLRGRKKIQFRYPSPYAANTLQVKWFYAQDRTGQCKLIHKKINGKVEVLWDGLAFRFAEI